MATAPMLDDYGVESASIERRRKLADMMLQGGLSPLEQPGTPAGGFTPHISPVQGLAKMLQAYVGAKGNQQANEQQRALGYRMRDQAGQQLSDFQAAQAPTPGAPAVPAQNFAPGDDAASAGAMVPGTPEGAPTPPSRQAQLAAALKLASGGNPLTAPMGSKLAEELLKPASADALLRQAGEDRRFAGVSGNTVATQAGQDRRFAGVSGNTQAGLDQAAGWGQPFEQNGALVQTNANTGQTRQVVARPPQTHVTNNNPAPVTPVTIQDPNNPNGTIIIDGRTKAVLGQGPKLTDAGKLENKRQFNMQGIGATIQEAENLLGGTGENAPTGSGLGNLVDKAGGFVGMSPRGAVPAAQLRAVSGALVSKMPRMEGPQSDKDVQLYKESAGQIGDATVPVEQRVKALEKVKGLWAKYERLNPGTFEDRRQDGAGGRVVDFNSLPK